MDTIYQFSGSDLRVRFSIDIEPKDEVLEAGILWWESGDIANRELVLVDPGYSSFDHDFSELKSSTYYGFQGYLETDKLGKIRTDSISYYIGGNWTYFGKVHADANATFWFIDETIGHISGKNSSHYRTNNGGSSWIDISHGGSDQVKDIFFTDANTGYMMSRYNVVRKTTNGGINWEDLTFPSTEEMLSMHFVNPTTGFISTEDKNIWKTTDGGDNWTSYLLSIDDPDRVYDFDFVSETTGFALTLKGLLFKTTDGGNNWTQINSEPIYYTTTLVEFHNENEGIVVSGTAVDDGIYRTTDGGNSWTLTHTFSEYIISNIFFLDESVGLCCGSDGKILRTDDGGLSWKEQFAPQYQYYTDIQLLTPDFGFALSNNGNLYVYE